MKHHFLAAAFSAALLIPAHADSTVVFNEVMYHPSNTNEAAFEWIELHNQMAVDMDVSGWSLTGGVSCVFSEGTVIPGGGYAVVASSPATLVPSGALNVIGAFTGFLANEGETIELRNNNHRLMDSLEYGVDGDWPVAPDGAGVSLAKRNEDGASADPANWTWSGRLRGTPGSANFPSSSAATNASNIVPISATWRFDQSGNDFGTNWLGTGYNDSGWQSGAALLAVEDCACLPEPIRTTLTLGRTNYYFRSKFNYTGDPSRTTLQLRHVIDDGAVVYLNGGELWRIGMPVGPITFQTFATRGIGDAKYEGPFTVPASSLVTGTNVLAVEVHQAGIGSSDIVFGLALDETRTVGGTEEVNIPLAFNEVASATSPAFWLELINYGTTNVALDAMIVARIGATNREYILPPQSLAPGAILQLTRTNLGYSADPNDKLVLYTAIRSNVLDAVVAKRDPRARFPDGTGAWIITMQPTPGASNIVTLHDEIVINEIMYDHRPLPAVPAMNTPTNHLVTITNLWRYSQDGNELGTAWRQPGYNDSTWPSGAALLYSTPAVMPAPKNTELQLANSFGTRLVTWYFRAPFVFTGDVASAQLTLHSIIDDGAVFYLNGVEVYRYNMPGGTIAYTNLASAGVATAGYTGPTSISPGNLLFGTNVLAVEVHQFTTNALGADMVFGTELLATSFVSAAQPQRESPESWIELYNRSTNAVSLGGWEFDGGIDFKFATNQMIAAGGYLVLARDTAHMLSLYPSLNVVGPFAKSLSGSSDHLVLRDPLGNIADAVRYYSSGRWPEFANGAGSSLELRDPRADNAQPEAWAPSDESTKTGWNTYAYRGIATAEAAASPTLWKEFVLGLIDAGEVLLDDISVIESPGGTPVQFIQSGNFENGLASWRFPGNHKGNVIVDPDNPGNHVLRLVATGSTGHLHNHVETTFANGAQVVNGREYEISFRAKWLAGNNDILTRLYFNRLPRVTSLAISALNGTPGSRNSRYATNAGPTYTNFRHAPVVPQANEAVSVFVTAADLDGVNAVALWSSANGGAWNQTSMTAQANGGWRGSVPGAAAGTLVQFYVEGVDGLGVHSTFPAAGPASRALYKVNDGAAILDRLHNIRILMTTVDTTVLHAPTNVMSDGLLGTTVIYNEEEIFYDIGIHLQGSERGRNDSSRVGYTIRFNPDHLFRGVHDLISIDRSGGYSGRGGRHDEILIKHAVNHAGGLPGMYDDLVHVIAPRAQENGTGLLLMAKYNKVFLDSQYENGNDGSVFKLELIYFPLTTADGTPQGYKLPQPDDVLGTEFRDLGDDKESYRWNFLKENHEARDDFDGVITLAKTLGMNGAALDTASRRTMDVNEWMRAFAFESLFGIADTYGYGYEHNLIVYVPPEDRRAVAFLWDMDFGFYLPSNSGLYGGGNIAKLITLPGNLRLYYSHLYDLITRTVNTTYMSRWSAHYAGLLGQDWSGALGYIGERANFVLGQLPTTTAFAITSNGGNDFTVSSNLVTLTGTAPIQLEAIEVNGISYPLTWTGTASWTLRLPVGSGTNFLALQGFDRYSGVLSNLTDTIRVVNTASVPPPNGFVVINEIMYHSPTNNASFVEIHNAHPSVAFDLSNWRLDGVDMIFPEGTVLPANGFLVVASETNVFTLNYPNAPQPIGQYPGTLQNGGETLKLLRPITTNLNEIIDVVRYDDALPWPTSADGFGPSLQLIDPTQDNTRVANWAAASPTPGAVNSVRATLAAFPPIWLNELLVFNTNGIRDNFNQREPWIELFNAGTNSVSLQGCFLTDNFSNLTRWPFPVGASLAAREFRVIWADGEPAQTATTNYHTNFRLTNSSGFFALVRTNAGRTEVLDYINYPTLTANRSFGSVPDGQSVNQEIFYFATPGASNNAAPPPLPVVINEWMADNAGPGGLRDPLDGLFQDWFELYNPDTNTFDLSGHFLTDTLAQSAKWQIPPNTFIAGHGFLLVWADNQTNQNGIGTTGDLHAAFQLSAGGEEIGLFAPDGSMISGIVFGPQMQNVSQGLYPDGNTNAFYFMPNWTPRAANQVNAPAPTDIGDVSLMTNGTIAFQIPGAPYRAYRVDFKDVLDAPAWTPLSTNRSDNGLITISEATTNRTQRFYRVILLQ